jgi:hypothetical protein
MRHDKIAILVEGMGYFLRDLFKTLHAPNEVQHFATDDEINVVGYGVLNEVKSSKPHMGETATPARGSLYGGIRDVTRR